MQAIFLGFAVMAVGEMIRVRGFGDWLWVKLTGIRKGG
jgi:hypothetical protein